MQVSSKEIRKKSTGGIKGEYFRSFSLIFLALFSVVMFFYASHKAAVFIGTETFMAPEEDVFGKKNIIYFLYQVLLIFLWSITAGEVIFYTLRWHYLRTSLTKEHKRVSIFKVFILNMWVLVAFAVFGLVFFIPPALLSFVTLAIKYEIIASAPSVVIFSLDIITLLLLFVCGIFLCFFMMRYFLCPFLLTENPSESVRSAVKNSKKMMKNEKSDAAVFMLSLFTYILPCLIIIPAVYFLPKIASSVCLYGKYIIEKNRITLKYNSYN